jgi:hypothetical protein
VFVPAPIKTKNFPYLDLAQAEKAHPWYHFKLFKTCYLKNTWQLLNYSSEKGALK